MSWHVVNYPGWQRAGGDNGECRYWTGAGWSSERADAELFEQDLQDVQDHAKTQIPPQRGAMRVVPS